MAATSPWYYVQVLVNVNAFTNPSTSEGPTAESPRRGPDDLKRGSGDQWRPVLRAVPIAT
jgi:hypothetical protein